MFPINQIPLPVQLYVPLVTACLLGATAIGLLLMMLHDQRIWEALCRKGLGRRLRGLRMNRMIGLRGISRELYIRLTPIVVLRKDMDTCRKCLRKNRCDTSYIVGVESDHALSYCPNTPSLDRAWGKWRRQ